MANGWHYWTWRFGLQCCKHCGIVRRRDENNKPCPGKVRVALRENRTKTGAFGPSDNEARE